MLAAMTAPWNLHKKAYRPNNGRPASAALCLWSSSAHEGNGHDAQKRAEHGTEYEYGGEHQQES
jgi:hypothetical protein